jgi:hypothetical protein
MGNTSRTLAGLMACSLSLSAPFVSGAAVLGGQDNDVTLKGCLVKGEGDGSGYLLTNAPAEPAWQRSADTNIQPSTVGTSGGFESVFYWLDDDGDLKKNIGHQVEIKGDLKGDLKDGEIELDRKDNWTELTVKSDGRTMKAHVPNASLFPATREDKDKKVQVLVRKVDVEQVTMLSASCADAR